jgi:hypothetical protein
MRSKRWQHVACGLVILVAGASLARAQVPQQTDALRLRAWAASVRSDLRNLVVAQESYFADHVRYATSLDSLRYAPSQGVTAVLERATPRGWSASARHEGASFVCSIYVGDVPKPRPDASEGSPLCEGLPAADFTSVDSLQRMFAGMGPMFGNVMSNMFEGLTTVLARPEVADRLAAFTRNYYEALVRRGFSPEESLRIVAAVGIPSLR